MNFMIDTTLRNPAHFEALFAVNDDPWDFRTRWYEARKRSLTLASLPRRRYASGFEPGCANGELSAALAERCDHLLVSDGAAGAVDAARRRLRTALHVEVTQAWVPQQWPERTFDLIVLSEFAYYLDVDAFDALVARVLASLRPGGTVLACHWRRRIAGCLIDGDGVHAMLRERLQMANLVRLVDADFNLDVWCADPASVAEDEGLA